MNMKTYAYEYEIVPADNGYFLIYPFELPYATEGIGFDDAMEMTSDILRVSIEECLMAHKEPPTPGYGHKPQHGGQVFLASIATSLDTIDAMRASEAAEVLGVTRGRITQMVKSKLLEGFHKGRDSYVTKASVEARLQDKRAAGRPKKASGKMPVAA
jgi:predicted RNase H-like HicB family nuclease